MDNAQMENEKPTGILKLNWPVHGRLIHVYETDKDGVVHFSNYLRMAEEAIFAGFRAIGYPLEDDGNSIAMLKTNVNYYLPIKFPEYVEIVLNDLQARRVKFSLEFDFLCKGKLCAKIQLVFATIDSNKRKAIPLNTDLRTALNRILIGAK